MFFVVSYTSERLLVVFFLEAEKLPQHISIKIPRSNQNELDNLKSTLIIIERPLASVHLKIGSLEHRF